jgi:hypothetical protein
VIAAPWLPVVLALAGDPSTTAALPAADSSASPPAGAPAAEVEEIVEVQEVKPPGFYAGESYPEHERILALPTGRGLRKGSWLFLIDHRARSPIYDGSWSGTGHDFAGLDAGVTVGLGLRYGIRDGLDVGVYRAAGFPDTYELDLRWRMLAQERAGLDLAVRGGATWFSYLDAADSSGFFGQLLADRVLFDRLVVGAAVLFHSNSTNGAKFNQDTAWSLAAAAMAELRLAGFVALSAEVLPALAGYHSRYPAFSAGVKFLTHRHTFAIVVGNTTYLTADGYLTNSPSGLRDAAIGFNLSREL